MKRTNKIRIALAALAATAVAVTGTAGAASLSSTQVTIKNPGGQGDFYGKVKSSNPDCVSGRKVVVFKQLGATQDRSVDQKIASDTADAAGNWSVGNTGQKSGHFYAKAAKTSECKAATSPTI
jgi:hypothetical protein